MIRETNRRPTKTLTQPPTDGHPKRGRKKTNSCTGEKRPQASKKKEKKDTPKTSYTFEKTGPNVKFYQFF